MSILKKENYLEKSAELFDKLGLTDEVITNLNYQKRRAENIIKSHQFKEIYSFVTEKIEILKDFNRNNRLLKLIQVSKENKKEKFIEIFPNILDFDENFHELKQIDKLLRKEESLGNLKNFMRIQSNEINEATLPLFNYLFHSLFLAEIDWPFSPDLTNREQIDEKKRWISFTNPLKSDDDKNEDLYKILMLMKILWRYDKENFIRLLMKDFEIILEKSFESPHINKYSETDYLLSQMEFWIKSHVPFVHFTISECLHNVMENEYELTFKFVDELLKLGRTKMERLIDIPLAQGNDGNDLIRTDDYIQYKNMKFLGFIESILSRQFSIERLLKEIVFERSKKSDELMNEENFVTNYEKYENELSIICRKNIGEIIDKWAIINNLMKVKKNEMEKRLDDLMNINNWTLLLHSDVEKNDLISDNVKGFLFMISQFVDLSKNFPQSYVRLRSFNLMMNIFVQFQMRCMQLLKEHQFHQDNPLRLEKKQILIMNGLESTREILNQLLSTSFISDLDRKISIIYVNINNPPEFNHETINDIVEDENIILLYQLKIVKEKEYDEYNNLPSITQQTTDNYYRFIRSFLYEYCEKFTEFHLSKFFAPYQFYLTTTKINESENPFINLVFSLKNELNYLQSLMIDSLFRYVIQTIESLIQKFFFNFLTIRNENELLGKEEISVFGRDLEMYLTPLITSYKDGECLKKLLTISKLLTLGNGSALSMFEKITNEKGNSSDWESNKLYGSLTYKEAKLLLLCRRDVKESLKSFL
ncbi:hypothetical protein SNEBB_006508 [Seison nebaliae]|nr:hypothetical protein SNEBB_006508 [Seison nebaliae]